MNENSQLRVVFLLENNGYPRDPRVRREAETLAEAGFSVAVICPAISGECRREVIHDVQVMRYRRPREGRGLGGYLWEYGYSLIATFLLLLRIALNGGVDVIHAANPPDLFVVIAAGFKLLGVRFIYDQHDLVPEMYQTRFKGKRRRSIDYGLRLFEKWSYRLADRVVVTNLSYKEVALGRGGVVADSISVVRNGPDEAHLFHRATPVPALVRSGKIVIGYLGIMGVQDGVDYLIRALFHLRYSLGRADFLCVLIGSGEEQASLRRLSRSLGLEDYVSFVGFVSSPGFCDYLCAADLCVVPDPLSEYNDRSTMIKVMDYMAAAKPIVAFEGLETRRSAGDAALYVAPNDELAFAKAIAHLMDNRDERIARGNFGRRKVEQELSWTKSAQILLQGYAAMAVPNCGAKVTVA
jgi:glycosyltransferase involved in cell wall biosynthesis